MKKVMFILLTVVGSYGLAFAQQSTQSPTSPSQSQTRTQTEDERMQGTQQQRPSGTQSSTQPGSQSGVQTQPGTSTQSQSGSKSGQYGTQSGQSGRTSTSTGTQSGSMQSADANWEKIGEGTIDSKKTRDEVSVNGKYKAIKIKSMEKPVTLSDLEVEFESGDNQSIPMESTPIQARGESKVLNLNSADREVKKIHFGVQNAAQLQDEKAKIEIWGLKDDKSSSSSVKSDKSSSSSVKSDKSSSGTSTTKDTRK